MRLVPISLYGSSALSKLNMSPCLFYLSLVNSYFINNIRRLAIVAFAGKYCPGVACRDIIYLLFDLLTTMAKLLRPGGSRALMAENLLLKQQLIIHGRSRQRAPNLTTRDRALLGLVAILESQAHCKISHYHQAIDPAPTSQCTERIAALRLHDRALSVSTPGRRTRTIAVTQPL